VKADPAEHVKMSEKDFLAKEADDARKAISAVSHEMVGGVGAAIDPRPMVGKHPWMAMGAAAVAGFAGASMVTPSKQDAAIKKLETLSKSLRAAMGEKVSEARSHMDGSDKNGKQQKKSEGIMGMIFNHVVKPAITATIAAKMKPSSAPAQGGSSQQPPPGTPDSPSMG
jgi:DNA helicase TIP49 (TBP-interacting protein)